MKQASLLITFCALLCLSASAQTTTIDKNEKRITITTTKVDDNGKAVTETWIAEGDQPEQILEKMAVNPDVMQKMNNDDQTKKQNEERLFLFRNAGENVAIEGKLSDTDKSNENVNPDNVEKAIIISNDQSNDSPKIYYHGGPVHADVWVRGTNDYLKNNCAALGVYVDYHGENGTRINSLIENSGAKEAGLQSGDVINKIEKYDITDFPSLHDALSHYVAGDVVSVRFVRGDQNLKTKVELKDWAQLPGQEWRARTDCGNPVEDEDVRQGPVEGPTGTPNIQQLDIQDARVFPNPTEGAFALSFQSKPGPLTISITDVNGKVVYHENNDNAKGSYNHDIDLKDVPQGNYILSVNQGGQIYTQQISKQ